MTTIAYKDGVIAYDSQITSGSTITYDDYQKCHEVKGVKFVMCGKTCDYTALQDAYFGASVTRDLDTSAIVLDGDGLWYVGADVQSGFWKSPVRLEASYAIGSGADHAITAMDMGLTAYQAVEMAAKRDTGTGGTIRTLIINEGMADAKTNAPGVTG
ncbi:proteasome subunit beta [Pseudomonas brassicacearum]|uniref:Proteasome subunit beta n=1 Tax=Pseudomonas brassicacearum TaxID=930166 RepID=A0A423GDE9_9PSED|nr:proteasome subunit beta [Pseudomonas brassicacearum]ROM84863.1 proteasome subunit beta [Pseudomonas brassicacearum]